MNFVNSDVPEYVLDGLDRVAARARTNMYLLPNVIAELIALGQYDAADWLRHHADLYPDALYARGQRASEVAR